MKRLKMLCVNMQFYALFGIHFLIGIPMLTLVVLPCALCMKKAARPVLYRRAIYWYAWVVIRLGYPLVRVRAHRVASEKPLCTRGIIVCNHRSTADGFLMAALPPVGFENNAVQVVKPWPMRIPVLGRVARGAGYLSIREMSTASFFEQAGGLLRDGVTVIVFPEGTRSGSADMGSFNGAAFRLALQTHEPIIPVCIAGGERVPCKGSLRIEPGEVRLNVLEALTWDEYRTMNSFQLKNHVRELMQRELQQMEEASE